MMALAPLTVQCMPARLSRVPTTILRSEEHTSELQSRLHLVCRLLLEKKNSYVIPILIAPAAHESMMHTPAVAERVLRLKEMPLVLVEPKHVEDIAQLTVFDPNVATDI